MTPGRTRHKNTNASPVTKKAAEAETESLVRTMSPKVQILTIEQAESIGWNNMVAEHPLGSVFQHTAFMKVISATFGHTKPYCLSLLDKSGRCLGGLAIFLVKSWLTGIRLVSIPFAYYADPMISHRGEFEILFREILELSKQEKASYVEIKARNSADILAESNLMIPVYYHKTYFLDLTKGLSAIWDGFHRSSVKQGIRRAERSGVKVRPARSEHEAISFYHILARDRRRLGLPPQKPEYFQNVRRYLVPRGLAQLWIAYKRNQLVGGLCNFIFKKTVFMGYIGIDVSYRHYGVGQSLVWNSIRAASERSLKIVDFGKASPHADGQINYKKNWGTVELKTPVFYYPRAMGVSSYDNEQNLSYKLMRTFWAYIPLGLSTISSRFFYRHTG